VKLSTTTAMTAALAAASAGLIAGCGTDSPSDEALDGVSAITFIQRPARAGVGNVFAFTTYRPGARLVKLSPPTADGELQVLCCEQHGEEFADIDIGSYDLSFDAREIVFSARLSSDQRYGLFVLSLESGELEQLPTDPGRHYVHPIFLPGDRIMFVTDDVVEEGAPQFRDEYDRAVTSQWGTIRRDGSDLKLGARNLSHRVYPSLLGDGRVMFTQWDHLGPANEGHLLIANPDMTTVREGFGKEGTGVTNSYIKAVEVSPGRVVAIGTSRERTIQAGAILDIRLGEVYTEGGELRADRRMSEANASYRLLTPQVPLGREPSPQSVGRYYSAYPLSAGEDLDLLVSWSPGPVESGSLEAAGLDAEFGVYLYDSSRGARRPIWNEEGYWSVHPRPLVPRAAPPQIPASGSNAYSDRAVLLGSMNVYDSSLMDFEPDSIYAVRVLEGYSSEEGAPRDFGLTLHEGSARLGIAPVQDDGSWAALIPPTIPVHLQAIDRYGMALLNEPVWISGNPGESRFCGGCHEDRASTTVINPGITEADAVGPVDLMSAVPRRERSSYEYGRDEVVGVPWDLALQPIFDAKCVSCHDGTPSDANPSYTIFDPETGESQTITFDLRGDEVALEVGDAILSTYSASHLSLLGPMMMELEDAGLEIQGDMPIYVRPTQARNSALIRKINPPLLYPEPDTSVRAFDAPVHPVDVGGEELTPDEYHLLILMSDAGGQFYSRENIANLGDD
jgi:hypothetical protein